MIPDESSIVSLYERMAEKNINIIRCVRGDKDAALIVEYAYTRPSDNKLIWPKLAVVGDTVYDAAFQAEALVDRICGRV